MSDFGAIITTVIAIGGVFFLITRLYITITAKTEIEIILTSNQNRRWELFLEYNFISMIFTGLVVLILLFLKAPADKALFYKVFICLCIAIVGFFILIIILQGIRLLFPKKEMLKNIVMTLIIVLYIAIFMLFSLFPIYFRSFLREKIISHDLSFLTICTLVFFCGTLLNTYGFIKWHRFVKKPASPKIKMTPIEPSEIRALLSSLYFTFTFDQDTQVYSPYPVNRAKIKLPLYVFYPKENALYYCYHENETHSH